jgi:hypothetical protein
MGVVHQAASACDDHFLSRVRVGLSHALDHRPLRENKGRPFVNFKQVGVTGGSNMLEKLGGLFAIVIAVTGMALISVYHPPVYAQIILAFVGSVVCLVGIVFMFAEGQIFEHRRAKKAPKVG